MALSEKKKKQDPQTKKNFSVLNTFVYIIVHFVKTNKPKQDSTQKRDHQVLEHR